jgi:hypothetical protein
MDHDTIKVVSKGKDSWDSVACVVVLFSMVMSSTTAVQFAKKGWRRSQFKGIMFVTLLSNWFAALVKCSFICLLSTIPESEGSSHALWGVKIFETLVRHVNIGCNFAMFALYAYLIHCSGRGRKIKPRNLTLPVIGMLGAYALGSLVLTLSVDKLLVTQSYVVLLYKASAAQYAKFFFMTSLAFQVSLFCVIVYGWLYFKSILQVNPTMRRVACAYHQLMLSFAFFNIPTFLASLHFLPLHVLHYIYGWRACQGAVDAVIIYRWMCMDNERSSM